MRSKAASLSPAPRCNGCATGCAPSPRRAETRSPRRARRPAAARLFRAGLCRARRAVLGAGARGALIGLTAECGLPEIARATLEAVGYQTRDLIAAMAADCGLAIDSAAGRWRHGGERLDDAVPRRHPAGDGRTAGLAGDHRVGRGLCRRAVARAVSAAREMMARWSAERRFAPADGRGRARGALCRLAARRRRRARRGLGMIPPANLLRDLPDARGGEDHGDRCSTAPGMRIERIVSLGQASPPGFWYDQDEAEWVLLLAGAARLRFADESEDRVLGPGDFCAYRAAPAAPGRMDRPRRADRLARDLSRRLRQPPAAGCSRQHATHSWLCLPELAVCTANLQPESH